MVAIKQMGILKEERVAGGVGRSRSSGDCCGRGPWWWWWFWTLPENKKGGIWRLGTGYGVGGGWWQAQWLGAVVVVVIGVLMGVGGCDGFRR